MIGEYTTTTVSLDATGGVSPSAEITSSDFTDADGTNLGTSDSVVVRSIITEQDTSVDRIGDPNSDGTFEISFHFDRFSGERSSDGLILTNVAGLRVTNESATAEEVTVIGQHVPSSQVFVEQSQGLSSGSTLYRTTASHGDSEQVFEVAASAEADIIREVDANDDGTFEQSANVESIGSGVKSELWLGAVDIAGRTNPQMRTGLNNTSSGTADYMILGTIGGI